MEAATQLLPDIPIAPLCRALDLPRTSFYAHLRPISVPKKDRPKPARTLNAQERQRALDVAHSPRFINCSPSEIVHTLLMEDQEYICSVRTMYRILADNQEVHDRRNQLHRPNYVRPGSKPSLVVESTNHAACLVFLV